MNTGIFCANEYRHILCHEQPGQTSGSAQGQPGQPGQGQPGQTSGSAQGQPGQGAGIKKA